MRRSLSLLFPLVLTGYAFAQKVEFKHDETDATLRFSIQTKMQTTETRKTLVNGEEPAAGGGGRGFGGGGGESSFTQEVEFDQGPAKANWREYKKLAAVEVRPGRDGENRETKVEGGLQGKKVFLGQKDGKLSFSDGDGEKAAAVAPNLVRGLPGRVSLYGLLPASAVAPGEEFDLSKSFLPALRGLVHPVNPDRAQAGAGGRGQGGEGGQGGQGGQARGGRGGGMGGMGGQGTTGVVIQLLSGGKLGVAATGKLAGVDEKDGRKLATLELKAKLTGKGTNEEMGLPAAGGFGGRGGRGGAGGQGGEAAPAPAAPQGTSKVDTTIDLTGKVVVDLGTNLIVSVEMQGDLALARDSSFKMDRNGEEMKMESSSQAKGKFAVTAAIAPAK